MILPMCVSAGVDALRGTQLYSVHSFRHNINCLVYKWKWHSAISASLDSTGAAMPFGVLAVLVYMEWCPSCFLLCLGVRVWSLSNQALAVGRALGVFLQLQERMEGTQKWKGLLFFFFFWFSETDEMGGDKLWINCMCVWVRPGVWVCVHSWLRWRFRWTPYSAHTHTHAHTPPLWLSVSRRVPALGEPIQRWSTRQRVQPQTLTTKHKGSTAPWWFPRGREVMYTRKKPCEIE